MGATRQYGPAFIANSAADILSTPSSGSFLRIRHIHVVNVGAASTFSLFIGATGGSAAGTQVMGGTRAVPANTAGNTSVVDWYPDDLILKNTQYLSGVAADASRLVITVIYEIEYLPAQ